MVGITAFGAYVPRSRLQRVAIYAANGWYNGGLKGHARGERSFAGWDEDVVTMAVEAARACLNGRDRATITGVTLCSTTAPFADRQNAGIVKEALVLRDDIFSMDLSGGQRAGTAGLIQALSAGQNGGAILCVASERRRAPPASEAEMLFGHAAAAIEVGTEGVVADFIGSHSATFDFVDHFRAAGAEFDYDWESRWIREEGYGGIAAGTVIDALARFGLSADAVDHFILPAPGKGIAEAVAKKAGIALAAIRDSLAATVGFTGVAHPLLMLAHALDQAQPGQLILVAGFGQGCDVLLFRATDKLADIARGRVLDALAWRKADDNYVKYLSFTGGIALDRGMRAEFNPKQPLSALFRNRKAVLGLVGGRCTRTGTVQYPKSDISVDRQDPAIGTQEDYPLADRLAQVITYTADVLAYTPDPPGYYGMVEFEGGGRMPIEFVDSDADAIVVGSTMRMVFRIKSVDEQRDFTRYFWKATVAEPDLEKQHG